MEKEVIVIKIDDAAYVGYRADEFIDATKPEETPVIIPPAPDYMNADEVRF